MNCIEEFYKKTFHLNIHALIASNLNNQPYEEKRDKNSIGR